MIIKNSFLCIKVTDNKQSLKINKVDLDSVPEECP